MELGKHYCTHLLPPHVKNHSPISVNMMFYTRVCASLKKNEQTVWYHQRKKPKTKKRK